jgi:hypothetical protein
MPHAGDTARRSRTVTGRGDGVTVLDGTALVWTENSNRNDASPAGRPGRVRCKDAGSPDMSHIGATEDAAARRTGRSDGSRLHFDSSS